MRDLSFVPRNIVVTFNEDIASQFISWSKKINKLTPSKVVLNKTDMLSHMTLYTTNYPKRNLNQVSSKLEKISNETLSFPLSFNGKSVLLGTIFIDAVLTQSLYELHEKIVNTLNPLREGNFDEKERELPGFNDNMEYSLTHYGMWSAKKLYVPHVSVARPFDGNECKTALSLLPENIDISTTIESISFVERGQNGTCKNILKTFPLKKE